MASDLDGLKRMKSNYIRIGVLVTQVIAAPNRTNIDAVIDAANGAGVIRPKVTYSIDGESYDWTGYQTMLLGQIKALNELIQIEGGAWEQRTRPLI